MDEEAKEDWVTYNRKHHRPTRSDTNGSYYCKNCEEAWPCVIERICLILDGTPVNNSIVYLLRENIQILGIFTSAERAKNHVPNILFWQENEDGSEWCDEFSIIPQTVNVGVPR